MEKAVGIVCEYNPMHAGHMKQLAMVRRRFGEKPIVLVMSGHFVQRASAAVCDHTARAAAALNAGADLVLLLPFPYSTFGAQGYARAALRLLSQTGAVDTLAFGAEEGDWDKLFSISEALTSEAFEACLRENLKADPRAAYAHVRAQTLDAFCPGAAELLKRPNNILAVEYLLAIREEKLPLTPAILPRPALPSATVVRDRLAAGMGVLSEDVPDETLRAQLERLAYLPSQKMDELLLSALRGGMQCPELDVLGERIAEAARHALNFEDFLERAKTRKITAARVRRGVLHAYFGVEEAKCDPVAYSVLLGAGDVGRKILSFIYKEGSLPIFTKPSAPLKEGGVVGEQAALHARADSVYAGLVGRAGDCFLKQNPVIVNNL